MGPVTNFIPELSEYISSIPSDPLKNSQVSFKNNTYSNRVSTRFFEKVIMCIRCLEKKV